MAGLFRYYRYYSEQARKALMPAEDLALEEKWIA